MDLFGSKNKGNEGTVGKRMPDADIDEDTPRIEEDPNPDYDHIPVKTSPELRDRPAVIPKSRGSTRAGTGSRKTTRAKPKTSSKKTGGMKKKTAGVGRATKKKSR